MITVPKMGVFGDGVVVAKVLVLFARGFYM
jgi:hypothetical protein